MKINVAYDRLGEYNLSHTDLHDRFKNAPKWIEFDFDQINENTIQYFSSKDEKFVYNLGTVGGPKWWLCGGKGKLFDYFSTELIAQAQKGNAWIHIDQSMEGFPLLEIQTPYNKTRIVDAFRIFHDNLETYAINPSQLIYSTSNLIEKYNYDSWCREYSVTEKFHIVTIPFFACATQQSGFFDWIDRPDYRDDPHNVLLQDQINYKSTHPISLLNCLNRVQRTHRAPFVAMLNYYDLVDDNIVSHNEFEPHLKNTIKISNWPDHPSFNDPNFSDLKLKLPLTYDMQDFSVNHAQNLNKEIYLKTYVSVITETLYEDWKPTVFFSEKIFKPMRAHHPFVLVCHQHGLHWLKRLGFKTFNEWWDESYDDESDPVKRMEKVCMVLKDLQKLTVHEWVDLYQKMSATLTHNYNHLTTTQWFQGKYHDIF